MKSPRTITWKTRWLKDKTTVLVMSPTTALLIWVEIRILSHPKAYDNELLERWLII